MNINKQHDKPDDLQIILFMKQARKGKTVVFEQERNHHGNKTNGRLQAARSISPKTLAKHKHSTIRVVWDLPNIARFLRRDLQTVTILLILLVS